MSLVWDAGGEKDLWHVCSGGAQSNMSLEGYGGGEEHLNHVCNMGHSLTYIPCGDGGEDHLNHVCSGGCSVDTCPQRWMLGEWRICGMYAVGDG